MITDTEIKTRGIQLLAKYLGDVEAERFIALIQREPFDYTKWRQEMFDNVSVEEISSTAMSLRKTKSGHLHALDGHKPEGGGSSV